MKEFSVEKGAPVKLQPLFGARLEQEDYIKCHAGLCIPTHDVFLWHNNGFLLVKRNNCPEKGEYWPVGGRVLKCVPILASLAQKVRSECGLSFADAEQLDVVRGMYASDPYGHGKGSDNILILFAANASGDLLLDADHSESLIVTKEIFATLRSSLHPIVVLGLEKAFLWKENGRVL